MPATFYMLIGFACLALLIAITDDKPHGWRCYLGRHTPDGKPKPGHVGMIFCKRCRRPLAVYDWSQK